MVLHGGQFAADAGLLLGAQVLGLQAFGEFACLLQVLQQILGPNSLGLGQVLQRLVRLTVNAVRYGY